MKFAALIIAGLLLAGCGADTPFGDAVARVNGEAITQAQWDAAVRDLERSTGAQLDDAGRRKILESLVQSRLMANAAETMLDAGEMTELDAQASLQRERLLVKEYLRRTADPAPITAERVRDYYAQHPEHFGAGEVHHFELLTTESVPAAAQRQAVLDAMGGLRAQANWKALPRIDGAGWVHRLENGANSALDDRIGAAANRLQEGETSEVVFIDGRPYLLRTTRIERREPKPLTEVRASIERRLQIEQLQHAVDRASETLLSGAEVEYLVPAEDE